MAPTTRQTTACLTFGQPSKLPPTQLPSNADIYRYYEWKRLKLFTSIQPASSVVSAKVAQKVINIWERASLPVISIERICERVQNIRKRYKQEADKAAKKKTTAMIKDMNELFDVCQCRCDDMGRCSGPAHSKVPILERSFLTDQRTSRLMHIENIDKKASKEIQKRQNRMEKEQERIDKHRKESEKVESGTFHEHSNDSDGEQEELEDSDDDFVINEKTVIEKLDLTLFALECDRNSISDSVAARLLNAVLVSVGIVDIDNRTHIYDKSRVHRLRENVRNQVTAKCFEENQKLDAIYFDSRKDKTKVRLGPSEAYSEINEKHYSLVSRDNHFLGHFTVVNGRQPVCFVFLLKLWLNF